MHEEQDTCRICSAPAEPDQPLFYPCKCSGTIRYIHQDCLTTWLAHSKKKTCDVCKHSYSFEKVYSADMPARLPLLLIAHRLMHQTAITILFAIRVVVVGLIWGALLPWATIWTWRMYFSMGDSTAWWISNRERPKVPSMTQNVSTSPLDTRNITASDTTAVESFFDHPAVRAISADIVAGQIIATIIVVAFVAIFLLREWISQNARPGIFDDGDAPPEGQAGPEVAIQADLIPPPVQMPPVVPEHEVARPDGDVAIPEYDAAELAHEPNDSFPNPNDLRRRRVWPAADSDSDEEGRQEGERRLMRRDKGKQPARGHDVKRDMESSSIRRRHSWNDVYGRSTEATPSTPRSLRLEPAQQEFSFRAQLPQRSDPSDHDEETTTDPVPETWKMDFSNWNPLARPQPREPNAQGKGEDPPQPNTPGKSPGRPPLYSTALFTPVQPGSPAHVLVQSPSRHTTPLGSPSLATYRAPEELEAGPSNLTSYFPVQSVDARSDSEEESVEDNPMAEWQMYFREPRSDEEAEEPVVEPVAPAEVEEEREADAEMPGLQLWTDEDEMDEEDEDGPEDVAELDEPAHPHIEVEEGIFPEIREMPVEEPQGAEPVDANEELEAGMEDDMEGALEDILAAVGLRGPIYGVLQNAALMIVVLDATIGIGVCIPFTIGKCLALLSLEPRRLLYLLDFPIRAIRIITDPVVDSFMFFFVQALLPPLKHATSIGLRPLSRLIIAIAGEQTVHRVVGLVVTAYTQLVDKLNTPATPVSASPSFIETLLAEDSTFMRFAEPYFAPLGEKLRIMWANLQEHWIKLALGDGTTEKIFAVSLGYVVDAILLAIYLNLLTVGSMKSAGRAVRNAVRQQLLVVKVAGFILVELVVFPLGCGIMLDICTISLFPQGSFQARMDFLVYAPLTSAFYHWVVGTMFMYQFAVLLAGFRTCLRPGALWFIKDPQDQNFHPIREILERPTFVHIKKLILSGIMYALVVACSVGTIATVLRVFSRTIMPFRWKIREPLSVVPVDLLFLHLVLPYTLQYFKPRRILRQIGLRIWKQLAHQLRLTSYLFGGRDLSEEFVYQRRWYVPLGRPTGIEFSGTFRRVPNSDNVALVKNEPATVEVDSGGQPVDEKAAHIMHLQDAEAEKARRNVKDDYIVVYLPPHFRYRVIAFTAALWIVCSVVLASFLGIPILLGRYFFKLFIPNHVHDGYAFIVGFHLLWACWLVSHALDRMDKHRQRRGGDEERADFTLYIVKRSLLWIAQASYMMFSLGVVIPTLIAIVVELYVILPARHAFHPEMQLHIRVVDMWALGLLYMKILLRLHRLHPIGPIAGGIEAIRRNGWNHLDPIAATKDVIGPLIVGLVGMILLPPVVLWSVLRAFKLAANEHLLYLNIYPCIFVLVAGVEGALTFSRLLRSWSQVVRDEAFLVEMRLQNLELGQEGKADADTEDDIQNVDEE